MPELGTVPFSMEDLCQIALSPDMLSSIALLCGLTAPSKKKQMSNAAIPFFIIDIGGLQLPVKK